MSWGLGSVAPDDMSAGLSYARVNVTASHASASLLIVGLGGCTDVGAHLRRAATTRKCDVRFMSANDAHVSSRWLRSLTRRLCNDFPLRARAFNKAVCSHLENDRPRWLLTTGSSPVLRETIAEARRLGVTTINYSTDDPWNPRHAAPWQLSAIREYDVVATPRAGTIAEFRGLGVRRVIHVPFAYCPDAHCPDEHCIESIAGGDVFFAGGCDSDRLPYFREVINAGLRPILCGAYWDRHGDMRRFHHGFASPSEMATLHAQTPVSICLVRRANRDEHVMRTYEAAAMGACLAMEDTPAHRRLFGADGESVVYFTDPDSLVNACKRLLADPGLRQRLRVAAREAVVRGRNTYADRLDQMLAAVSK